MSSTDHIRAGEMSLRTGTNSPTLRHNSRLATRIAASGRERGHSLDLTSLRTPAEMPVSSLERLQSGDEDEQVTRPLLPSRAATLTLTALNERHRDTVSPHPSSRSLTATNGDDVSLISQSPPSSHTRTSSSAFSSSGLTSIPLSSEAYGRLRSSSFGLHNYPYSPVAHQPSLSSVRSLDSLRYYLQASIMFQFKYHLVRSVLLSISFVVSFFVIYIDFNGKCHMQSNLSPLLLYTTRIFNEHSIEYWVDYGTLLGGVRSHEIIPHEFDVDLSSNLEECEKILALREHFPSDRYHMYGRDDWIPEKASFIFGYGGFMHKPCVRIYDLQTMYYVDIDWHLRLPATHLPASPLPLESSSPANVESQSMFGTIYLPAGYQPATDGDLLCNEEGFNGHDPGGCRRASDVFPLQTMQMHGSPVKAPRNAERVLKDMYGASWLTPRPKGYKILFCVLLPPRPWLHIILFFLYIVVPFMTFAVRKADHRVANFLWSSR